MNTTTMPVTWAQTMTRCDDREAADWPAGPGEYLAVTTHEVRLDIHQAVNVDAAGTVTPIPGDDGAVLIDACRMDDMTPAEARRYAADLLDAADLVDRITAGRA
ncbi:hypothetical protein [Mobilicoccus massiliensis]|uniref:hypothetical protein n=1 Tax=Mobilicoccus massiliensis TaxID=1522310 RepID=UPI00058CA315|nr:hypothetical protein [Mobilicoccus massiliensis]